MTADGRSTRRRFLSVAVPCGIVASGGLVWRAMDRRVFGSDEGIAFDPWESWREDADKSVGLARAGVLASSARNAQPWIFRCDADRIEVHGDLRRHIGVSDPYLRSMYLSLGCAVENIVVAAYSSGWSAGVRLDPGALTGVPAVQVPIRVARIDLRRDAKTAAHRVVAGESYAAIAQRHTNRGPFTSGEVSEGDRRRLVGLAADDALLRLFVFDRGAGESRRLLERVLLDGVDRFWDDPALVEDEAAWLRTSHDEISDHMDGLSLDAEGESQLALAAQKMFSLPTIAERLARRPQTARMQIATAPLLCVLAARKIHDRQQALRAGRLWQRIQLWSTARGLASQPIQQAIDLIDVESARGQASSTATAFEPLLEGKEWKPMVAFRLGYAEHEAPRTPRRDLFDVLAE